MAADGALPAPDPAVDPAKQSGGLQPEDIVKILGGYLAEAETARKTGLNPRDATWERNWDLYWGRYDFSKKASWQSKIVMPEASQVIDRWAAAMKQAIAGAGAEWFEASDPADTEGDLKPHIMKFVRYLLDNCGRTADGHVIPFPAVFEEIAKVAALTAAGVAVTWKIDRHNRGYVAADASDPRATWIDPEGRGLYRVRRFEIDKHKLIAMAKEHDSAGKPLYNMGEIDRLAAHVDETSRQEHATSSGAGGDASIAARKPIVLHEWLCTILDHEGNAVGENVLCVVANSQFLIRGPEPNPFWHRRDWLVHAPMITVPFSVYGRSYVESWASVAFAFIEMTNLILDGTYTTAMKAFAAVADMLEDPTELEEGIHPNKVFVLQDGSAVADFMKEIDLGQLPPSAVTVWQALKQELREGSLMNEIALGQVPQKGGITATEVTETSQQSSAMILSVAESIEQRVLEPVLYLMWATGLQHIDFTDPSVVRALGADTAQMLNARKAEFRDHPMLFKVRGISATIKRAKALRDLMAAISVIATNDLLLAKFLERFDVGRLLNYLFELHGVDTTRLELSDREKMVRALVEQAARAAGGAQPGGGTEGGTPAGLNSAITEPAAA